MFPGFDAQAFVKWVEQTETKMRAARRKVRQVASPKPLATTMKRAPRPDEGRADPYAKGSPPTPQDKPSRTSLVVQTSALLLQPNPQAVSTIPSQAKAAPS